MPARGILYKVRGEENHTGDDHFKLNPERLAQVKEQVQSKVKITHGLQREASVVQCFPAESRERHRKLEAI